jgi:GNAT superfamily N-acetyltransferase
VHAYRAAKMVLERFGGDGEPQNLNGAWTADCRGVSTERGPVDISVQLSDVPGRLVLDGMSANPRRRGGGTMLLEALADYCRRQGLQLNLHGLDGTEGFYRSFSWLIETRSGSRNYLSSWDRNDRDG